MIAICLAVAAPLSQTEATKLQQEIAPLDFEARLHRVVAATLGTPYHDGPLGEGPGAKYDADPLIDLSRVDCVTFIEQAVAIAVTDNFEAAVGQLQKIRYRGGKIDFGTRNHFMISDWIANNPWCRDISQDLDVETASATRTISRRSFFEKQNAPELGAGLPDQVQTLHYVPLAQAVAAEANLPNTAILIFIGKIDWLFALHCGVYLRDADGTGKLHHASSKAGKAVALPLAQYLEENKTRYLGFTAYAVATPSATAQKP